MATIAENLQTLVNIKAEIKSALTDQKKEPTDAMNTYAELIGSLENPDDVTYFVTVDGVNETRAVLNGEEKVALTAGTNDIRIGTTAINERGVVEGEKIIPCYQTTQGYRLIPANTEFTISKLNLDNYDYTKLQAMTMPFNSSVSNSVAVEKAIIEDCVYNAGSTEVISNVTKDDDNKSILLGITNGSTPAIIRFFTCKEVP